MSEINLQNEPAQETTLNSLQNTLLDLEGIRVTDPEKYSYLLHCLLVRLIEFLIEQRNQ